MMGSLRYPHLFGAPRATTVFSMIEKKATRPAQLKQGRTAAAMAKPNCTL